MSIIIPIFGKNMNFMKDQPAISVLVPCYNVEKYIRECLDSIVSQTLTDLEIICLNDGSKDGTLKILEEYGKRDRRIVIIDKENSGYGATMNIGLEKATGKYIGIVESDDYIESGMMETLFKAAETNNLDYARCLYREFNELKHSEKIVDGRKDGAFECDKVFSPMDCKSIFFITPSIWAGIYRRDFLNDNGIRFLETPGASYQDASFAFKTYACARRMMVVPEILHNYRINGNSSVSSPGKVYCVCDEENEIRRFAKERGISEELKGVMALRAFASYKWNYKRLSFPLKRQFIKKWSEEAKAMFERGEVTREYFSKSRIRRLHLVAYAPWIYYFSNQI